MSSNDERRATTSICGFDADNILIRKKNLVDDLIGKYSFTELMLLQALGKEPTDAQQHIVDAVLVTIMEHGLVPSAVATRLTYYGAPESFQGAVVAGLLGVGQRFAGTASECGEILERIVAVPPDDRSATAVAEVNACREKRKPVPGFGHPIHREEDRRVDKLIEVARGAGVDGQFIAAMELLESSLQEATGKQLVTNISAAIAAVLGEAGIPAPLMRGIVLTARCAGLVGHLYEEMHNPAGHDLWMSGQSGVDYQP